MQKIEQDVRKLLKEEGVELTPFSFPQKEELKIFIKDILEGDVEEKYYLSEKLQERFSKYLQEKENKICAMRGRNTSNPSDRTKGIPTEQRLEFNKDGCSNSLTSVQKDNLVYDNHRKNEIREYDKVSFTLSQAMGTGGNNVPCVSSTLTTELSHSTGRDFFRSGQAEKIFKSSEQLRRLTPKECFRLMGFLDDGINLENLSDTQRYKLAGNGWDINLVSRLFNIMFNSDGGSKWEY